MRQAVTGGGNRDWYIKRINEGQSSTKGTGEKWGDVDFVGNCEMIHPGSGLKIMSPIRYGGLGLGEELTKSLMRWEGSNMGYVAFVL